MSLQPCPNCGRRAFTWSLDDEVSPLTQWHGSLCRYRAEEDESRESGCQACGAQRSRLRLSDRNGTYWFCLSCQSLHRIVVADEFDDGGKKGNIQNGWAWYTGI
jgi:hypothetical protein